jgi:serine/threonine-protein kinase
VSTAGNDEPNAVSRAARGLFLEWVELTESEQQARLAACRRQNPELAQAVVRLLAADRAAEQFMEGPAAAWLSAECDESSATTSRPPAHVGSYRVLELLGRGGMGEVFVAERADGQFEQQVALKLLRKGLDSDEILARFRRERQILARLDHPNVARLLDGGSSDDGRPYFVMERVRGVPINEYCRQQRLPLDQRLRLVIGCCEAVSAAHRALIVHRDLKPSNILIDEQGRPKLLDFGIAKLLDEADDGAVKTRAEWRVLTPDYAAPEQILGEPVTTATDVYALGLILHELLTDQLPHARGSSSLIELAQRASETTSDRPSALVKKSGDWRQARLLRGDLDTIIMKALQRDPQRRYPTAAALADDLQRYLEGHPVLARPDSIGYRLGKFVRRRALLVGAAAVVMVSLVSGLTLAVWQAQRAAAAAKRSERVIEMLVGVFDSADPNESGGRTLTAQQIVSEGLKRIDRDLQAEPETRAELYEALSRIKQSLGEFEGARTLAQRAIDLRGGVDAPQAATAMVALGSSLVDLGQFDAAHDLLARALAHLEQSRGVEDLATAQAQSALGNALYMQGHFERAAAVQRAAYETTRRQLGDEDVRSAEQLRNLGIILVDLERFDEAQAAHRRVIEVTERQLGKDHPQAVYSRSCLAFLLQQIGQLDEAEQLYRGVITAREQALGPHHPQLGETLHALALLLTTAGRLDEAATLLQRHAAIFRRIDPNHFELTKSLAALAHIDDKRTHYAAAEAKLRHVVAGHDREFGAQHPFPWQSRSNLAVTIANQGRLREAEALFREALAGLERLEPRQPAYDTFIQERLAECLVWQRRGPEALPLLEPVLRYRRETFGAEDPQVAGTLTITAAADLDANEAAAARLAIDTALAIFAAKLPHSRSRADALLTSARIARHQHDNLRAERELEQAIGLYEAKLPPNDWRRHAARAELGALWMNTGRADRGRTLLKSAHQAMTRSLGSQDPRVPQL